MPADVATTVFNNATGYSASVSNLSQVSLASDLVFGDNTSAQNAAMMPSFSGGVSAGYAASVTVGLAA